MARGRPLSSLIQDYRVEVNASSNPAHNASARDAQVRALQRAQEALWRKYDWPFLRVRRYLDLQAGQRYYDPRAAKTEDGTPASDLGVERLEYLEVRDGEEWVEIHGGLTRAHYATWDSDRDQRSWPAERWSIYEDESIEIWPLPSENANTTTFDGRIRLVGIRDLRPLVADSDICDLDDTLIVKTAAVKALARAGSKDGQVVLDEAKQLERDLTGNFSKAKSFSLAGRPCAPTRQLRGPARVHYRTT